MRGPIRVACVLAALATPASAQTATPETLYREGIAARDAGRPDEAIDRFRRVLEVEPGNVDARVALGFSLTARRRFDEAEREFERVLNEAPNYGDARLGLARIGFFKGDLAAAERRLAELRERDPENAEAAALTGQVRRARDAARKAAVAAEAKRRADEGRALRRRGAFAAAERAFRDALRVRPQDADLWVDLGLAVAFQGRFPAARAAFERALALNPRQLDAVLGLARVDLYTNALDKAETRVAQVLAARPGDADAQSLSARLRLARGDAEGAETAFRSLAARNGRELDHRLGLGDALRAQGRDEEARGAYEEGRAIDPASVDVLNRLALKIRPRWRVDVSAGYSDLSGPFRSWAEGRMALGYSLSQATALLGAVEVNRRFGLTDVTVEGQIDRRWNETLTSFVRAGGTPDANFRPEIFLGGGGTVRLLSGEGPFGATIGLVEVAFARYTTGDTRSGSIGLQQYVLDGRVWLTGQLVGTVSQTDDRLGGYLVRADWLVTDRVGLFLGYSDAPDPSDGRTVETRALFGGVSLAVGDEVTLRLSGAREDRKESYDRTTVNLGLTTRF